MTGVNGSVGVVFGDDDDDDDDNQFLVELVLFDFFGYYKMLLYLVCVCDKRWKDDFSFF